MTKKQREAAERNMLQHMIDKNPKLKAFLDASVSPESESDKSLHEIIEPIIKEKFEQSFMNGIHAGFNAALLGAATKIEQCATVQEAVDLLKAEADRVLKKVDGDNA